ncbi:MAG TPA: PadR family transcriptional regulator [Ktedonobacteraceae bacterium]|nr:PadR family transcriptional regulator [Ktedonobacteraceae bacterium]
MAKENKSKYALLGILSMCPGSGYDIKKFMEQSTSNFWSESYGQIYPILKQLVEEGFAISHTEKQEGKPERYVYTLTEKGLEELRQWLTEPIEQMVERNELLLKLFFGRQNSLANNIEHVKQFQKLQEQLLHKYLGIEAYLKANCADNTDMCYSLIAVRYGIHRCQALLTWCKETIDTLRELAEKNEVVKQ